MKTLNSYTVIIKINDNEEIFNKAYINGLDNSNLAIKGAIDVLSGMNEDKYIGILVVREKCYLVVMVSLKVTVYSTIHTVTYTTIEQIGLLLKKQNNS